MINIMFYLAMILISSCSKKSTGGGGVYTPQPPVDKNWQFEATPLWADEFDYTGLPDASKWGYDIGGGGWGNNELQYYSNLADNAKVEGGSLVIKAKKESMSGMNYTSARLVSKNKGDFLYGRIEVRAKLPTGKGTWPAIWMLPTDWAYGSWPRSGEIDIMEHVGYDPNKVHFTVHTEAYNHSIGTQKGTSLLVPGATTDFHKYRVDWTPYAVRGYFDDQIVYTFVNEGKSSAYWPFDKRFHLLLNIAIGGNWGGAQGVDDTIFPQSMLIDYVRVYKMIE
jgi:beta-glucanase (GH16 family)